MARADSVNRTRRAALQLIAGTAVAAGAAAVAGSSLADLTPPATLPEVDQINADADLIDACRSWLGLQARWHAAWSDHDDAIEAGRDATVLAEIADVIQEEERTAHRLVVETPATSREGLIAKATVLAAWLIEAEEELAKADPHRPGVDAVDLIGFSIARDVRALQREGVL